MLGLEGEGSPGEQLVDEEAREGGLAAVLGTAHDDDGRRGVGRDEGDGGGPVRRDDRLGARTRRRRRPRRR
jgi:hypothetical protein